MDSSPVGDGSLLGEQSDSQQSANSGFGPCALRLRSTSRSVTSASLRTQGDGTSRDRLMMAAEDMVNAADGLAWVALDVELERQRIHAARRQHLPTWTVLDVDVEHKRGLFITRDIITHSPYNKEQTPITWEKCSLRQWLNTTFFEALPSEIKSRIVEVVNQNPDNTQYSTSGGNPTSDRVFLLSIDEAVTYLKDNANRFATFDGSAGWWWLRSSGRRQYLAANVDYGGGLDGFGVPVSSDDGGVRPALFLNLDG